MNASLRAPVPSVPAGVSTDIRRCYGTGAMATSDFSSRAADPWAAFGRLIAGVAIYGGIGGVADLWLNTSVLLPLGIVAGAALGLWATFVSLRQL